MSIDFKVPFRTSFGLNTQKDFSMVELHTADGLVGYGDCSAFSDPGTMRRLQWGRCL